MNNLFLVLTSLDVLSVRVPVGGAGLKLVYLAQLALLMTMAVKGIATNLHPFERRSGRAFLYCQIALLIAVCIPLLINTQIIAATRNYTIVLASWVITFLLIVYHIRISAIRFIRTYIFSIIFLLGLSLPAFFLIGDQRMDSIFGGGTNRLGLYATIGMLVCYYILSSRLDLKFNTIYKLGICICIFALVLTFSRSAILALLVAMLEHAIRNKALKLSHVAILVALVGGITFFLSYMYSTTNDLRYLKLMVRFGINELLGFENVLELSGVSRVLHYQSALDAVVSSWDSLAFGLGMESYRSEFFLANSRGHDLTLHSLYLQYFVGGGVVALSVIVIYVFLLLKTAYSLKPAQTNLCCFILIPSLVHAAFQPAIFSREIFLFVPILILSFVSLNARSRGKVRSRVSSKTTKTLNRA